MCGIIGVTKVQNSASVDLYEGLLMLQHRGQDAAGMVTFSIEEERFFSKKDNGLVKDVFAQSDIEGLKGTFGMGHVRYPTAGSLSAQDAQPFFVNAPLGIYLVHNGNLTNTKKIQDEILNKYYRHLQTGSDSEALINVLADKIQDELKQEPKKGLKNCVFNGVEQTMEIIEGAYAVICLVDKVGLLAFRDTNGIRPLALGKRSTSLGDEWMVASEDVAFYPSGFEKVRDVEPGEAIIIDYQGNLHTKQCTEGETHPCIFEYVYLARPDSILDNISVYKTQLRLGTSLSQQIKDANLDIDSVIPVPDSGRPVALEISKEIGVKYREGLVKNRYIGRTFIMPGQETREKSLKRKLNAIPLEFKGRNVLLVDDSIVRGTTMRQIIQMCRNAGAAKVYVASAAPPIRYPNVYGVDMPTHQELLAHNASIEEMKEMLGADALFFQTLPDLIKAAQAGNPEIKRFEDSCFSGDYITGNITKEYLQDLENDRTPPKTEQRPLPL